MHPRLDREGAAARAEGSGAVTVASRAPAPSDNTRFVWFWSFWAWSCESYRVGALLRPPLEGIGSNWDGWFRHEASVAELRSIQLATGDDSAQCEFLEWLFNSWARDLDPTGNRSLPRFVATQLARSSPFRHWPTFENFKHGYQAFGISAIILAQGGDAQADDVRLVEALALPDLEGEGRTRICTENFRADDGDLSAARVAAQGLFQTRSVVLLFTAWACAGRRHYGLWMKAGLTTGWLAVVALLMFLWQGPDPGNYLRVVAGAVVGLWCGLSMIALSVVAREAFRFTNEARLWEMRLARSHLWFRVPGGLTVKGGSAGLAFCLNAVQAIHRAFVHAPQHSWIWERIFDGLSKRSASSAATGVVTAGGKIEAVVLEPKLRACAQHQDIRRVLVPWQRVSRTHQAEMASIVRPQMRAAGKPELGAKMGFAAGHVPIRLHRCFRIEAAFFAIGGMGSSRQLALNSVAILATIVLLTATQDLRCILIPPPAPIPIGGVLSGTEILQVSLATSHADCFRAALESEVWVNRRVGLTPVNDAPGTARLKVSLVRIAAPTPVNPAESTIWMERRFRLFGREFEVSEKVGRFSFSYLSQLGPL